MVDPFPLPGRYIDASQAPTDDPEQLQLWLDKLVTDLNNALLTTYNRIIALENPPSSEEE